MDRVNILNHLIDTYWLKSYINIGVFTGYSLDHVYCENKFGVDPEPQHYKGIEKVYPTTSDEFFKIWKKENGGKFSLCFIDGMHLEEFVLRDIHNCLEFLDENGFIVLHDCLPKKWEHAQEQWLEPEWNGTVYKAILRFMRDDYFGEYVVKTVNTDYGCTIIERNVIPQKREIDFKSYTRAIEDFNYFQDNKENLFNIISPEEFYQTYI